MTTQLVKGSLGQIAAKTDTPITTVFLDCDMLILVDISASMNVTDTVEGLSRHAVANQELERLQMSLPGKIALVEFSDITMFKANGILSPTQGSTALADALRYIHVIDDCGVKIILISDGEPNSPSEALTQAKRFKTKIDVIHIGDDNRGKQFLDQLAQATGGEFIKSEEVNNLSENVVKLLVA